MANRLELHEELCNILGTRQVYFQPPASVVMKYDAIRYELAGKSLKHADDRIYQNINQYDGVVITRDPDSGLLDTILEHFEMCSAGRPYVADNLHHFPFTLYW